MLQHLHYGTSMPSGGVHPISFRVHAISVIRDVEPSRQHASPRYHFFMVDIRILAEANLDAASDLCVRAKSHWGYDPEFINLCVPALKLRTEDLATSDVVGALCGDQLVGVAQLFTVDTEAMLDKLFVEPEYIGTGIGRTLFEWAVRKSTEWGAAKILIESDPFAVPAYTAFGCKQVGFSYSEVTRRELPTMEYSLPRDNLSNNH